MHWNKRVSKFWWGQGGGPNCRLGHRELLQAHLGMANRPNTKNLKAADRPKKGQCAQGLMMQNLVIYVYLHHLLPPLEGLVVRVACDEKRFEPAKVEDALASV